MPSALFRLPLATSGHVPCMKLRSAERPQALLRRVTHQGLQTQTNGFGVGRGAAGRLRLTEEAVIDVEGFLHPYNYAI